MSPDVLKERKPYTVETQEIRMVKHHRLPVDEEGLRLLQEHFEKALSTYGLSNPGKIEKITVTSVKGYDVTYEIEIVGEKSQ